MLNENVNPYKCLEQVELHIGQHKSLGHKLNTAIVDACTRIVQDHLVELNRAIKFGSFGNDVTIALQETMKNMQGRLDRALARI